MKHLKILAVFLAVTTTMFLSGCAGGLSSIKIGGDDSGPSSGSVVSTGDGKLAVSKGASKDHIQCTRNHGNIAIEESTVDQQMMMMISRSGISSFNPKPLAQHAVAQSLCFKVLDRGAGFAMGEKERRIAGETGVSTSRHTSIARWGLRVEIPQPTTQTGAGAAGLLAYLPIPGAGLIGAVAGSVSFSEAQVILSVIDLRTSEVVASVTGIGKSTDLGLGGAFIGGMGGLGGGMSSKSPEVKVIAAGFVDAMNQLVPLVDTMEGATPPPEVAHQAVPVVQVKHLKKK